MRLRTEVGLALGAFAALVIVALAAGRRERGAVDTDPRASSYLAGPRGLRGLAEVAERRGTRVIRWRGRLQSLGSIAPESAMLVVANPVVELAADDITRLIAWTAQGGDVLLAGRGAAGAMECFGYAARVRVLDSLAVIAPAGRRGGWVHAVLEPAEPPLMMRGGSFAGGSVPCPAVPALRPDTLLRTTGGLAAAIRLVGDDSAGVGHVWLLSDVGLITNSGLQQAAVPEYLVGLLLARGRTLVFDEFHQRFGPQGSMATVALAWSRSSPWGWLIWQSAIVGFLAFVTGAVRFGPVRSGIRRARRSPLEHVRALATALSAARGHDVAIASIVNGLRRRLQAGEARPGAAAEPWPQWVQRLGETGRSAELRQHVSRLLTHATPGQPAAAVRDAAHTVEDVWQALHR